MNKPTTAAQYRAMLREKRKKIPTEHVELPSGLVFELQRPDLQAFIITGRYPQTIVQQALKAMREKGIAPTDRDAINEIAVKLDEQSLQESLIFMRELVRESCINPRIVMGAIGDDEIDPSELDIADFNFIVDWCLNYKGEKNAMGILSFRRGSERGAVSDQSDGQELQQDAVADNAN